MCRWIYGLSRRRYKSAAVVPPWQLTGSIVPTLIETYEYD